MDESKETAYELSENMQKPQENMQETDTNTHVAEGVDDNLYYYVTERGRLYTCHADSEKEAEQKMFDILLNSDRHG